MGNDTQPRILAVSGSYRSEGAIHQALEAALDGARAAGAQTARIRLVDARIEFCRNCRSCMQDPGEEPGSCAIDDEMGFLLEEIATCDAVILGAPVNFGDVNALTRQFMERCAPYSYWPWGERGPKPRRRRRDRNAALITSSAAPALVARVAFRGHRSLRKLAKMLGFTPLGELYIGAVTEREYQLPTASKARARALGRSLAERAARAQPDLQHPHHALP